MEVRARLETCDSKTPNLYLPKEEWKKLVTELGSNKMTVVLRIEGVG